MLWRNSRKHAEKNLYSLKLFTLYIITNACTAHGFHPSLNGIQHRDARSRGKARGQRQACGPPPACPPAPAAPGVRDTQGATAEAGPRAGGRLQKAEGTSRVRMGGRGRADPPAPAGCLRQERLHPLALPTFEPHEAEKRREACLQKSSRRTWRQQRVGSCPAGPP